LLQETLSGPTIVTYTRMLVGVRFQWYFLCPYSLCMALVLS